MPQSKKKLSLKVISSNVLMITGMISAVTGSVKQIVEIGSCQSKKESPAPMKMTRETPKPPPPPPAPAPPDTEERRTSRVYASRGEDIPIKIVPPPPPPTLMERSRPYIGIIAVVFGLVLIMSARIMRRRRVDADA